MSYDKKEKKRRDRLEIIAEIIELSYNPIKKTRIMYNARLSYTQLKNYLNDLEKWNLLKAENDGEDDVFYRRTEKGSIFLQKYYQILQLLESEN